jgi:1,2-diacylglycerol 3-alpha-glucosyltransferase
MLNGRQLVTVVVHWSRFGPYHLSRLNAADAYLRALGVKVVGLETASRDERYLWQPENRKGGFARQVVFPGRVLEQISQRDIWHGITRRLGAIRPDVVAISGYTLADSRAILVWSRLHRVPAILMTESKADDLPRNTWKEALKRLLVSQFAAALCGGELHRAYLLRLGLHSEQIFTGYDAVDNDYFRREADQARQNAARFRYLPGLNSPTPYFLASARFIKRKNLDGLLRAYALYRERLGRAAERPAPWRLVILGDGSEWAALQQLAASLNLSDICWPGFRQIDELPAYYGLAGAFIHPARQEQWGLVVNEAMAAGVPVLVSNTCGCVPDLIVEGENGFTFDPDNSAELADLMEHMSSSQVDLAAMGRAAQAHISRWGPERFAEGLFGALQTALNRV